MTRRLYSVNGKLLCFQGKFDVNEIEFLNNRQVRDLARLLVEFVVMSLIHYLRFVFGKEGTTNEISTSNFRRRIRESSSGNGNAGSWETQKTGETCRMQEESA